MAKIFPFTLVLKLARVNPFPSTSKSKDVFFILGSFSNSPKLKSSKTTFPL